MISRSGTGGPGRLVLIFALSVLLPSLSLAALAWRSVEKERRALLAERRSGLQRAAILIRRELIGSVEKMRAEEEERPYYQYEPFFFDANSVGFGLNYVKSPISDTPPSPLIEGYFQLNPIGEVQSPNDPLGAIQSANEPLAQSSEGGVSVEGERAAPGDGPAQSGPHDEEQPEQPHIASEQEDTSRTPARDDRAAQQRDRQIVAQSGRTRRAKENFERNFLPQIKREQQVLPRNGKGQFLGISDRNREQRVSKKSVVANLDARTNAGQMLEGQIVRIADDDANQEEEIDVVASPFLLKSAPDGGVLAYRYVDIPNLNGAFGIKSPFLRFVQGFTLDTAYVTGPLFTDIRARYLDVPGGRAALVPENATPPSGEIVLEESLPPLPGYRLIVTDDDPTWVANRVREQAALFAVVAGGLLLVITAGLVFSIRTVRAELGLARRKSDFVSAVTHELRTPLTGIKMYADMLKEGWVRDEATRSEYVGFMAEETDRLARLVNRVLDFARTEQGNRPVSSMDLEEPIRDVERDFGPFIDEKGFALEVDLRDRRKVLADPDAVKQILLNLLENAVKYARDAEDRRITLSTRADGAHTVLSVADHGPGVPEGERQRIFSDFYRTGEELTRETTGAGIGLALVKRLAEGIGGAVEIRENQGGGAVFRVLLRTA